MARPYQHKGHISKVLYIPSTVDRDRVHLPEIMPTSMFVIVDDLTAVRVD